MVAAHRRDPRGGADRRRPGRGRHARRGAGGARAGDARALRALLPRDRRRGRPARRDLGDPRRRQPAARSCMPRASAPGLEVRVLSREEEAPLRLPGGRQLDHAGRRRRARSRRRLDAAHPRRQPARDRRALLAAGRRAHDGALPARRARQGQAGQGAARARRRAAGGGRLAGTRRAARGRRRHGAQPRLGRGDRGRAALLRRPGLRGHARRARRARRAARRAARLRALVACRGSRRPAAT